MNDFTLTNAQLSAAFSDKDHLLIVAPPGCGKTEVLAHRAAHQISLLQPNQKVLALTFTKRARANLEERLRSVVRHAQARRRIVVRNFHGFATEVVLAHGKTIGLRMTDLSLPKTTTSKKAIEQAGGRGNELYDVGALLGAVKREPLSDAEVLDALQKYYSGRNADLALSVERARQETNQLHYEDLLRHAQRLLRIPAVAELYQAHFGAVLVDEFQDLSPQQLDVATLSCSERRTFAGDPLQAIFSWAGASPAKVEAEVRRTCGNPLRLDESYRSSPAVLETVSSVSEQINPGSTLVSALPDDWPGGGCSAKLVLPDPKTEAALAVRLATSIHRAAPESSIGIISRIGARRKLIDAAFAEQTEVPVRRWELAIHDPATVYRIQSTVDSLRRGATVAEARSATLDTLDVADVDARELVDDAFDILEQSGENNARAAVDSITTADPKQTVGPGVHLLTAHTGKGQQFDWVFVVGLEERQLPHWRNNTGDALNEERRILLVMLSRARHGLIVTRTNLQEGRYGPYEVMESRWWAGITARFSSGDEVQDHIAATLLHASNRQV